jgi:hypothetical protein
LWTVVVEDLVELLVHTREVEGSFEGVDNSEVDFGVAGNLDLVDNYCYYNSARVAGNLD